MDQKQYDEMKADRDAERTVKNSVIKNYDIALERNATLKRERDEARAAYEAETKSTAELMAENARLQRMFSVATNNNDRLRDRLLEWETNRVGAKHSESQREAAGLADEKSDGQEENS